jgi:flagellar biosynthesis/type III secretory pathway chaperone
MRNPLIQLISALEQVDTLYDEVLVLLQREKAAALASDIEGLMAATDEKRRLLAKISEVDQGRIQVIKQLASNLGLSPAEANLTTLAARVDPMYGPRLKRMYANLVGKVEQLRQANKESRILFHHCLNLVQNSLSFFNFWTRNTSTYGSSGTVSKAGAGRHLVSSMA